jgi:hypothetical protein
LFVLNNSLKLLILAAFKQLKARTDKSKSSKGVFKNLTKFKCLFIYHIMLFRHAGIERDIFICNQHQMLYQNTRSLLYSIFRMNSSIGVTSRINFSKSVRCSTRVFSIAYFTFLIGVKILSVAIHPIENSRLLFSSAGIYPRPLNTQFNF